MCRCGWALWSPAPVDLDVTSVPDCYSRFVQGHRVHGCPHASLGVACILDRFIARRVGRLLSRTWLEEYLGGARGLLHLLNSHTRAPPPPCTRPPLQVFALLAAARAAESGATAASGAARGAAATTSDGGGGVVERAAAQARADAFKVGRAGGAFFRGGAGCPSL